MLEIRNISVEIARKRLLDDVSLDMQPGEVVALLGPNGSGKSMLISTITGEQTWLSGSVRFHGKPIDAWQPKLLARHLAVLPQQSVLSFPFTGREVIDLARIPHNTGQEINSAIVDEVLAKLDAQELSKKLYPNLSGGEQQRIQLARVLTQIWLPTQMPRLLILDEPSSYFDLAHQILLLKLVREQVGKDFSVLIVLHDINMALSCADRVGLLKDGRLHTVGITKSVLTEENLLSVFGVECAFMADPHTGQKIVALRHDQESIIEKEIMVQGNAL
jgi:iron complex transport system ATP-binding protein